MVNTIWFQFDSIRFGKDFSLSNVVHLGNFLPSFIRDEISYQDTNNSSKQMRGILVNLCVFKGDDRRQCFLAMIAPRYPCQNTLAIMSRQFTRKIINVYNLLSKIITWRTDDDDAMEESEQNKKQSANVHLHQVSS